jgi:hypothetical protein
MSDVDVLRQPRITHPRGAQLTWTSELMRSLSRSDLTLVDPITAAAGGRMIGLACR